MQRRPTPKQIAAARANGAKPRFPVTDAGKQASSRNSVKAGIYSRFLAVCSEQRAAYERLTAENMNQYGPRNPVETDFVNVDRQRQRIKAEFIENRRTCALRQRLQQTR